MKRLLLIPALLLGAALPGPAQCVMCYRTAHAQNAARARVLDLGIVVLGAPPFFILAGFVAFLAIKNERYRRDGPVEMAEGEPEVPQYLRRPS